jgi:hypothetical protein
MLPVTFSRVFRMPLYEGIGLTEKQAVVIDIGAAYTK